MKAALLLCFAFSALLFPLSAQNIKVLNGSGQHIPVSPTQVTLPPLQQDAQALTILNQSLGASGGAQAIRAITDFTGTGNITYHADHEAQGTVTVRGLQGTEFRIDADLPTGTRSWAVHDGVISTKDGSHLSSTAIKRPIPSSDVYAFETPLFPSSLAFPSRQLTTVVTNVIFGLAYKGIVQIDGHSAHDIELQRPAPRIKTSPLTTVRARTRELFVDTSTFQIIAMKESLPKNISHEVHYSGYQTVNGILMPFVISEDFGGQSIWTIQLSQISFNTGLQASAFALQ